jgi:hypothetical protein
MRQQKLTLNRSISTHARVAAAIGRGLARVRWAAMPLLLCTLPAHATPAPPPVPPALREARMTVTVKLVETHKGVVSKITELCTVSGSIPVYADDGGPALFKGRDIAGCRMPAKGRQLDVSVWGAKAISDKAGTYATAGVSVVPPDAVRLCSMCGPQPLADSRAEIRVSGTPASVSFDLNVNPVSLLNAKGSVWLEGHVEIVD